MPKFCLGQLVRLRESWSDDRIPLDFDCNSFFQEKTAFNIFEVFAWGIGLPVGVNKDYSIGVVVGSFKRKGPRDKKV